MLVWRQKDPAQFDFSGLAAGGARTSTALAETYQPKAQERTISLEVSAKESAEVRGDERWLYQLLGNLLDNALKFTPPGGAVKVEVTAFAETVRLSVRDTGPGIPEESLERIFERFYQTDPSRAHKQGAGLGLAITAWIAESHEGRITASNNPEGGACFTIDLPNLQKTHDRT